MNQVLQQQGGWVRVRTGSMLPVLWPRKSVEVCPVSFDEVQLGDILVIGEGPPYRVHRLVRPLQEGKCQTAGDLCRRADFPVSVDLIRGQVLPQQSFMGPRFERIIRALTLWRFRKS